MPEVLEEGELNYGKFDLQNTVEQNILANLLGYEIVRQGEEQFALKRWDESERTVMTELYYVDREYRDSYYMYYARKHSDYERFTMRIIILKEMWRRKLNSIIQSGFKDVLLAVVSSDLYRWEPSESHSFHHAIYYAKTKGLLHSNFNISNFAARNSAEYRSVSLYDAGRRDCHLRRGDTYQPFRLFQCSIY